MKVTVDLSGLRARKDVLLKFGEIFEFGGPGGNHHPANDQGWGINWDAFNDSIVSLPECGIWGTSREFEFPLEIVITNHDEFQRHEPESFAILKGILEEAARRYANDRLHLHVTFEP